MKCIDSSYHASKVIAVFDFDDTLTTSDSLMPFIKYVVGIKHFLWGLFLLSPVLLKYFLKLIPNWQAKEAVLTYFFANKNREYLHHKGRSFAKKKIAKLLRPKAMKRFHWHQSQGHQTFLISASLDIYLHPWAKIMGFDRVACTEMEIDANTITGKIQGRNCYGKEKLKRLQSLLGNLDQYCIYAYGDSKGDCEILQAANYPFYRKFS